MRIISRTTEAITITMIVSITYIAVIMIMINSDHSFKSKVIHNDDTVGLLRGTA